MLEKVFAKVSSEGIAELFVAALQPVLPDFLVRFVVRTCLYLICWFQMDGIFAQAEEIEFVRETKALGKTVALQTEAANEQHYEIP